MTARERRLRVVNVALTLACVVMAYALWERRSPNLADPPAALSRRVTPMAFDRTPLDECLTQLTKSSGVQIVVNWDDLTRARLFHDTPVTASFDEQKLGDALRIILNSFPNGLLGSPINVGEREGVAYLGNEVPQPLILKAYDVSWARKIPGVPAPDAPDYRGAAGGGGIFGAGRRYQPMGTREVEALAQMLAWRMPAPVLEQWPGQFIQCVGERILVNDSAEAHRVVTDRLNAIRAAVESPVVTEGAVALQRAADQTRHRVLPKLVFDHRPFGDAVVAVSRATKLPFVVQWDRLNLFSDVRPTTSVTLDATGLELGEALNSIVAQVNGDANPMRQIYWGVRAGPQIVIGMRDELAPWQETRAYRVDDLVPPEAMTSPPRFNPQPESPQERFIAMLEAHMDARHVAPQADGLLSCWQGYLVVTCRPEGHDIVVRTLDELRRAKSQPRQSATTAPSVWDLPR